MLGSALCKALSEEKIHYDDTTSISLEVTDFLARPDEFMDKILNFDYVVNCIGQIKPRFNSEQGILKGYKINSIFPRILADICENSLKTKFVHITTDCVYDGKEGDYRETCVHTATDDYGLSKSLGEPTNCTVVRTSIIGEEVKNNYSLVEWVKSQAGNTVSGYVDHYWNGLTTKELSRCLIDIMKSGKLWRGTRHIHAPNQITKCDMIQCISDRFDLKITVNPVEGGLCDRTLSSNYSTSLRLEIPTVQQMIKEM